jgi:pimeloyl-ACP methyl ester carboxylesterase
MIDVGQEEHMHSGVGNGSGRNDVGFVFIHGGWLGPWCFDDLRSELRFPSAAVTLPGRRGTSRDELIEISLYDWVGSAAAQVAETLAADRLVLVAHSLGGIVLPGLAASLGPRAAHLVLIAGLVPLEGHTAAELVSPGEPDALFDEHGLFSVPGEAKARAMLGLDHLDATTAAQVLARLGPEPGGPLRARADRSQLPDVPITYVRGEHDDTVPKELATQAIANLARPVDEVVLPAGHSMILSHVQELARVVEPNRGDRRWTASRERRLTVLPTSCGHRPSVRPSIWGIPQHSVKPHAESRQARVEIRLD